ncbi:tetratricopeptide repeat protein [Zavarzinia sp. CC-PAN008]|uniref:tetratricopeptide repeat protein n=1 Tax=Zavarzinia sp. CC-PAN008 TaxID=3243332 RepID=UPI003F743399
MNTASPDRRTTARLAFERGLAALRGKDPAAALAAFDVALRLAPGAVEVMNARGVALRALKRPEEAIAAYTLALRSTPDDAGLWSNLGIALKDCQRLASALACLDRSIALSAQVASVHHNRGLVLTWMNRHHEAIAAFEQALALQPGGGDVAWDLARARLHVGDYRRGWPESESRWALDRIVPRTLPGARWTGEPLDGRRLLVAGEQGFGDTIWALRFLPRLARLNGPVLVECQPDLMALAAAMNLPVTLVPRGDGVAEADLHIPMMSLPACFPELEPANVAPVPYLRPIAGRGAALDPLLAQAEGRLKVGIVWSGSVTFGDNRFRALAMRDLVAALTVPGVQLFSLQKGPPALELTDAAAAAGVIDLAPLLGDFADTAAAVAAMDLVIMTDSGVAHLCGALGRPVWVLLAHYAYWLWLDERADSPWYPSMRLIRQPRPGDWASVLDTAGAALVRLALLHEARHRAPAVMTAIDAAPVA